MTETYPTPAEGWTCFHCGENFPGTMAGHYEARLHFGKSIHDEPKCQISAHRLRAMEDTLRSYREEDTDLHRALHSLQADHATALRREEEIGYARGIKDYQRVEKLLADAKRMAEFGDINAYMEDDGIGWKQWYLDVSAILPPDSPADGGSEHGS